MQRDRHQCQMYLRTWTKGITTTTVTAELHREPDQHSEVTAVMSTESYIVYIKGVQDDITTVVCKEEIKFVREIDRVIGPIILMKFRKNCVCVTCISEEQRQKLLLCKALMGIEIEPSLPWTGAEKALKRAAEKEHAPVRFNKVVITGVSGEWTDEQLYEEIGAEYIRRIKRRVDGQLLPTTAVVLGYVENPPEVVKLRYRQYRTRTYIEEPKQCHNCLRFGHLKANCRSTTRCPRCAGNHGYDDCTKKLLQEAVRCANCGESHSAKYRGCAKFAEVKQVLTVAATTKVSYADALKDVRKTNKQIDQPHQTQATSGSTVAEKKETSEMATQTETADVGIQTDVPTAVQTKEIQLAADKTIKTVIGIMDESLRRLHEAITSEMRRNYALLETCHKGNSSAVQQTAEAVRDLMVIVERSVSTTSADVMALKQSLKTRLTTMAPGATSQPASAQKTVEVNTNQPSQPMERKETRQTLSQQKPMMSK